MTKRPSSFLKMPQSDRPAKRQTTLSFAPTNTTEKKHPKDDADVLASMGVTVHRSYFDEKEADALYSELCKMEYWHAPLPYKNKAGESTKLKRAKIIYGQASKDGCLPFYGFPYVETPEQYPKETKFCDEHKNAPEIVQKAWAKLAAIAKQKDGTPWPMNQIMFTFYETGKSGIPYHSDKVGHLTPGAPIVDLILGPASGRPFMLQNPKTGQEWKIIPRHGDVIMITFETNDILKHAVPEDPKCPTPRISAVVRSVESMYNPKTCQFVKNASVKPT